MVDDERKCVKENIKVIPMYPTIICINCSYKLKKTKQKYIYERKTNEIIVPN